MIKVKFDNPQADQTGAVTFQASVYDDATPEDILYTAQERLEAGSVTTAEDIQTYLEGRKADFEKIGQDVLKSRQVVAALPSEIVL